MLLNILAHVCIWAKLLKFGKKKTHLNASDVSAYADDEGQLNYDSLCIIICIPTSCENAALATSVCGQRCKKNTYIHIFLCCLLLWNKWNIIITNIKQQCSISDGFFLWLSTAISYCLFFGWDALVQIAPVSSDLIKASSSIYAPPVEQVLRGNGWQGKLHRWWSGVGLAG